MLLSPHDLITQIDLGAFEIIAKPIFDFVNSLETSVTFQSECSLKEL